jgi:3-methyladenine DNA glycosylase AlkD
MSTLNSVMDSLKAKGSEKFRATYVRHGIPADRTFGVSNADLKTIAKTIKGQQALAMELYATGNMDAMYLAGIVADGARMTQKQLQSWADGAQGIAMISGYTVPWVAVDHPEARDLAIKWIGSKKEDVASAGWCTYAGIVATQPDEALDIKEIENLLGVIGKEIGVAKDRVKTSMNGFIIAVGTYVKPLLAKAKETAKQVGPLSIDVGDTACKVRFASEYIAKAEAAGKIGKKRTTIRC